MFPYIYHVDWYDWDGEKSNLTPSHGLVFADNYSTAVQRIIEYFGEENISQLSIKEIGDGTECILDLTEQQAKYFETEFT